MNEKNIQAITMEEIWKQNTEGHIPVLLDIYNPDLKWEDNSAEQENMHLRVIDDSNPVIYQGKKYLAGRFTYTPPDENGKSIGQSTITISAIDSRITQTLRSIELESEVTVVAAFVKEGSVYTFLPFTNHHAKLPSATYNRTAATLTLVNKDVLQLNIPRNQASKDLFPSVVQQ